MRLSTVAGIGIAASIIAWQWWPDLPSLARGWTALLIGMLPAFAVVQAKAAAGLQELPPRSKIYISTIASLWVLAFTTALVASYSGISPRLLGVVALPWVPFAIWFLFGLLGAGAIILAFRAFGIGETQMIHHMIPVTKGEKLLYVGVSLSAGICEELVFRGFLIATLTVATGSVSMAIIVSAVVFGIAHAHQDAAGALRAGLLALVLSIPLLMSGSLYPGIAAHAAIDLLAGLSLSKWLLKS